MSGAVRIQGFALQVWRRCPFCNHGAVDVWRYWSPPEDHGCGEWAVICSSCRAIGPAGETPEEAVTKWNKQETAT